MTKESELGCARECTPLTDIGQPVLPSPTNLYCYAAAAAACSWLSLKRTLFYGRSSEVVTRANLELSVTSSKCRVSIPP